MDFNIVKDTILGVLITNKEVTRTELCKQTGFSDRLIRRAIEELRCEGQPIGKPISGKGYTYGSTKAVDRCIAESYSRIAAEFKKIRGLKGKPIKGQIVMTEELNYEVV